MKVTGTVRETLTVVKTVTVEVKDGYDEEDVKTLMREKALKKTITANDHGWDIEDSEGIAVQIED